MLTSEALLVRTYVRTYVQTYVQTYVRTYVRIHGVAAAVVDGSLVGGAFYAIGMIGMIIPMTTRFHPNDQSYWDDSIPMYGGWLPHWDEVLAAPSYLYRGEAPQSEKNKVNVIHPKPHPNGATNLHPLGCYHPNGSGHWDENILPLG